MFIEADKGNKLEVVDNENGTKNFIVKQFDVQIDANGKNKIIEKEPLTLLGQSKEGLLKQKAEIDFMLSKFN